jgi:TonB family protein
MQEVTFTPVSVRPVGEWQQVQVRAERSAMTVWIDGKVASTVRDLDEFAGYIGFESMTGAGVEIRHVEAQRLPSASEPFGQNAHRMTDPGVTGPRAAQTGQPFYPREPHSAGVEGKVLLEVVVDRTGRVGDVRVVGSLQPDLDEAAIASARKWRFAPATKDGQPIDVIIPMEVEFKLRK